MRGGDAAHYRGMRTRVAEAQAAAAGAFLAASAGATPVSPSRSGGLAAESVGRLRLDEGMPPGRTRSPTRGATSRSTRRRWPAWRPSTWTRCGPPSRRAMDAHGGLATLPEVLAELPGARTGDVIGLWLLATRHGEVDDDAPSRR